MFERDKDELRELGIPLVTEDDRRALRRRARLPDRPARVRPAGHRLRARRAGRARPGQPHLGAGQPGRPGRAGAAQAAGRRRRARRRLAHRHRAAAAHHRAGLRAGQERRRAAPACRSASPTAPAARREVRRAARPAVGARLLARPLVPHRLRPRPRRAAGLPAVAGSRAPSPRAGTDGSYDVPADHEPRDDDPHARWPSATAQPAVAAGARRRRAHAAPPRHARSARSTTTGRWSTCDFTDPEAFADEVSRLRPGRARASSRRRCATPWSAGSRAPLAAHRGWPHERRRRPAPASPSRPPHRLSRLLTMVPWLVQPAGHRHRARPPPSSASPSSSSRPTSSCCSCAATARCPTS